MNRYQPLLSEEFYHVVNRAVGDEQLFKKKEDYLFFLNAYTKYIHPLVDSYAYSILPNHFHFLIKVKPENDLAGRYIKATGKTPANDWQPYFVMKQWSNLLNSYTKRLNKRTNRKGALFMDATRRIQVESETDLCNVIFYIHKNAVQHGYCKHIENWHWSSYKSIASQSPTLLQRETVLDLFGGIKHYLDYHRQEIPLKTNEELE